MPVAEPSSVRMRPNRVERGSRELQVDGQLVESVAGALADGAVDGTCAPIFGPACCGAAFADHARDYRVGMAALAQSFDGMRAEATVIAGLLLRAVVAAETTDRTSQP